MNKYSLIGIIFFISIISLSYVSAVDRYWVGGNGTWSNTTHWSNSSGGVGGEALPSNITSCIFDNNSYTGNYTLTTSSGATCNSLIIGAPTNGVLTFDGTNGVSVYGDFNITTNSTYISFPLASSITMKGTSGVKTINTSDTKLLAALVLNGNAEFKLMNNLTTAGGLNRISGTFNANNMTLILNRNTGSGLIPILSGGFTGSNAFYNIYMPSYGASQSIGYAIQLQSNIQVNNLFTVIGNTIINRPLITSDTIGTQRIIYAANTNFTNIDFRDIAFNQTTDLSSVDGFSGDCGGNTNITFTPVDILYWHNGTGNTNDITKWFNNTNGINTAGRVPLCQDIAIFDNNSFDTTGQTITQNMFRFSGMNWTGVTNNPTFTTSTAASVFGSLILSPNMTLTASTQTYTFMGRGNYYLDSANLSWAKTIIINSVNGSLSLFNNLFIDSLGFTITSGAFNANNYNITARSMSLSAQPLNLTMGNGVWLFTGDIDPLTISIPTGIIINAGNSIIRLNGTYTADRTFAGNGFTFNILNLDLKGSSALIISGSNIFNNIIGTPSTRLKFTASTTQKINSWNVSGNSSNYVNLASTSTTNAILNFTGTGFAQSDYLNISDITVVPANTWYAGLNSLNTTDAQGWIFSTPPASKIIHFSSRLIFSGVNRFIFRY